VREVIAGAGTSDEESAPLPLQVLGVCDRVIRGRRDGGRGRDGSVGDADDGDSLELQTLHAVHRADADRLFAGFGAERDGGDARRLQGRGGLLTQIVGSPSDADGVRLDTFVLPATDAFDQGGELGVTGGSRMHLGAATVQRGPVADQGVGLVVQAGDRGFTKRGNGQGENLLGGAAIDWPRTLMPTRASETPLS
jgi:hypothetical protein